MQFTKTFFSFFKFYINFNSVDIYTDCVKLILIYLPFAICLSFVQSDNIHSDNIISFELPIVDHEL